MKCFVDRSHGAPAVRNWDHGLVAFRFSEWFAVAIDRFDEIQSATRSPDRLIVAGNRKDRDGILKAMLTWHIFREEGQNLVRSITYDVSWELLSILDDINVTPYLTNHSPYF